MALSFALITMIVANDPASTLRYRSEIIWPTSQVVLFVQGINPKIAGKAPQIWGIFGPGHMVDQEIRYPTFGFSAPGLCPPGSRIPPQAALEHLSRDTCRMILSAFSQLTAEPAARIGPGDRSFVFDLGHGLARLPAHADSGREVT